MATIYRCDRCSFDFKDSSELRTVRLPHTDRWGKFTDETDMYSRELCSNCWKVIIEHVKPIPNRE